MNSSKFVWTKDSIVWLDEEPEEKGGAGSGHHGHGGRPGKRGGSAPVGRAGPGRDISEVFGRGATAKRKGNALGVMGALPSSHTEHIAEIEFLTYPEMSKKRGSRAAMGMANHHADEMGSSIDLKVPPEHGDPDAFAGSLASETQKSMLTHEVGHSVHSLMAPAQFGLEPRNARVEHTASQIFGGRDRAKLNADLSASFENPNRRSLNSLAESGPKEYFAESYGHYVHFPQLLKSRDPGMHAWMKDNIFDGQEYGS